MQLQILDICFKVIRKVVNWLKCVIDREMVMGVLSTIYECRSSTFF